MVSVGSPRKEAMQMADGDAGPAQKCNPGFTVTMRKKRLMLQSKRHRLIHSFPYECRPASSIVDVTVEPGLSLAGLRCISLAVRAGLPENLLHKSIAKISADCTRKFRKCPYKVWGNWQAIGR